MNGSCRAWCVALERVLWQSLRFSCGRILHTTDSKLRRKQVALQPIMLKMKQTNGRPQDQTNPFPCFWEPASAYGVDMSKTPKVVAIREAQCQMVAEDERTRRFILGVGKHRIAFDFTSRVTRLPDGTGDQPAAVTPMKREDTRKFALKCPRSKGPQQTTSRGA